MWNRSLHLLICLVPLLGLHHCKDPINNTKLPPTPSENYPHHAELDEQGSYFLYWKFDNARITFEVHVQTLGWVGFGLTDNGAMVGADMVVGWIKDGTTFFKDRHAVANAQPIEDVEQNYDLLSSKEMDGFTIFKFSRLLKTCDDDDYQLHNGTVRVIFAWNDVEPAEGEDFQYHGPTQRGARSIIFLDDGTSTNDTVTGLPTFDVLQDNVALSNERTYYHCGVVEAPKLNKKHHIVKVEPRIESGNIGIVHHILIMQCYGTLTGNASFTCLEGEMPVGDGLNCQSLVFAWAIGQEDFNMPEEAGMSVGDTNDPTYYMMETHYDNPQLLPGIVDSSGLRLHYTEDLRQYDVGFLTVGNTVALPPMLVPPQAESFRLDAFCGTSCTQEQIPQEGIKVFGAALHTHLFGVAVMTRQYRNGVELPPIARDDHYDSNYQAVRSINPPALVLPGDELLTSCFYSTPDRDEIVLGGSATSDEMCLDFLLYYPRLEQLQSCLSTIQSVELVTELVQKRIDEGVFGPNITTVPPSIIGTYYLLLAMPWDDATRMFAQEQINNVAVYNGSCVMTGDDSFGADTVPNVENRMHIHTPYVEDDICANAPTGGSRGLNGHMTVMATMIVSYIIFALSCD